MVEMHATVHGRVQGVFFRDTTKQKAETLGITGTVKNLPDGTVEIFAVGERNVLDVLITYLTSDQGPGQVSKTDLSFSKPTRSYEGFQVVY